MDEPTTIQGASGAMAAVVLCTRNRASQLRESLEHIGRIVCSIPWVLVIVDNGSTDNTNQVIEEWKAVTNIRVSVVYMSRPGLGRARNAGWRATGAPIIAFTDDDCYPEPNWLTVTLDQFRENSTVGYVGGRLLLWDPADARVSLQESTIRRRFPPRCFVEPGTIPGANFAFRREALEQIDGFDVALGAGTSFSCEDADAVARVSACGWHGIFEPSSVVWHHHRRRTEEDVSRLEESYDLGRGAFYVRGILNRAVSWEYLRHWYWAVRKQPIVRTSREMRSAVAYLISRVASRPRD